MKVVDYTLLKKVIQPRALNGHKGEYGRLLLIGGTYPFGGAIIMAAMAAIYSGAGLVTVATDKENIPSLHAQLPEAMAFDIRDEKLLKEQIQKADVLLIGPGLAENPLEKATLQLVINLASERQVFIMDGGAISFFSKEVLPFPKAHTIFTPHQKEWERLSGLRIPEQAVSNTQKALREFQAGTILVAKSHKTAVYQGEKVAHLEVGGPYQATGGMGDTLAGMITGFLAQFASIDSYKVVTVAVWLHSAIADDLAKNAYVVLPTHISKAIPSWMKKLSL